MRSLPTVLVGLLLLLLLGHASGCQPDLDARVAATEELAVAFGGERVDVGEVTLHVVSAGPADGPPVVLLHGFPEFWYAWRGPAAVLARAGFRVILPDQRGYNRSDKPGDVSAYRFDKLVGDLIGLLDALGHRQVRLGAQDMGAGVAWRAVIEHPERFTGLAVLDASHPRTWSMEGESEISWYRTFLQLPYLPGYTARLANWWLLTSNLRATSADGAFPEREMDQYRSAWDRDGAIHSMGAWYRADPWPLEGEGRVALPTLVMLAEHDPFIPAAHTRASLEFLDDGELLELGSGTHWVVAEQPERIGRILLEWFCQRAGGPRPPGCALTELATADRS